MNDLLSALQFRTAIPFGSLVFWSLWLCVMIWLILLAIRSLRHHGFFNLKFALSVLGLIIGGLYLTANLIYADLMNLNPRFTKSELIGKWQSGSSEFRLDQDGSAEFELEQTELTRIGISNGAGDWKRHNDFSLSFSDQRGQQRSNLRVIQFDDEYRIIVVDFEDFDEWDGDLGFHKVGE